MINYYYILCWPKAIYSYTAYAIPSSYFKSLEIPVSGENVIESGRTVMPTLMHYLISIHYH